MEIYAARHKVSGEYMYYRYSTKIRFFDQASHAKLAIGNYERNEWEICMWEIDLSNPTEVLTSANKR